MKPENQLGERGQTGAGAEPMTERRLVAWIGRNVRIEGKVVSEEDLTIEGHVSGAIELGGYSLSIGPAAQIAADLIAKTITISGAVKGNVKALERLELKATGSVEGDVTAPRFKMVEGSTVAGRVEAGARKS